MAELTPQQTLELIMLQRQISWFYQLEDYTDTQLRTLLRAVQQSEGELLARINQYASTLPDWYEGRALALLDSLSNLTVGIQGILTGNIVNIAATVGAASFLMQNDILSFGGRTIPFNSVSLTAEQLRGLLQNVPVGGYFLNEWINNNYLKVVEDIRNEIITGMLKGDSYPEFTKRLTEGFGMARQDAVTVARDYVHTVNTYAQQEVFNANRDIIKGVVWTAVLEPGYKGTGRGTCLRCAALDGTFYKTGDPHPPLPLHPRCRCVFVPKLVTWRELGLDMDELEDVYRPYTIRPDKNIDVGGRRTIIEHGFEQGNYSDWFQTRNDQFKKDLVGPNRFRLIQSGKIQFGDLVDKTTGKLILLDQLGG